MTKQDTNPALDKVITFSIFGIIGSILLISGLGLIVDFATSVPTIWQVALISVAVISALTFATSLDIQTNLLNRPRK